MNKNEWQTYWKALKRKMDEEVCPDLAGLDLIRGETLGNHKLFNHLHLQVYGKGPFLRNLFQRVLTSDAARKLPIVILASNNERELAKEAFAVLSGKTSETSNSDYIYSPGSPCSGRQSSFDPAEFFKPGECKFIYVELDPKGTSLDKRLLLIFEKAIKEQFAPGIVSSLGFEHPFIYIFCPELLEPGCAISEYVERLEDYAIFRVFSETMQIFGSEKASLLYGPDLYPLETYEKMRRHCYRHPDKKGLWGAVNEFFTAGKNSEVLKEAKIFAGNVPFKQTAFGRFKTAHKGREKFVWFYPVQQSLGKKPYETASLQTGDKPEADTAASAKPPQAAPRRLQVVEDLRPRPDEMKYRNLFN